MRFRTIGNYVAMGGGELDPSVQRSGIYIYEDDDVYHLPRALSPNVLVRPGVYGQRLIDDIAWMVRAIFTALGKWTQPRSR